MATMSDLKRLLVAADKTKPPPLYTFDDDKPHEPTVIPIPTSLDQRRTVIRQMMNHEVNLQAERARFEEETKIEQKRLDDETTHITRELTRHRIALSREMVLLGISAPMASIEELD